MNDSYPCICGHNKKEHLSPKGIIPGPYDLDSFCDACAMDTNRWINWMPAYHDFKLDNLKYLEKEYEKLC